MIHEHYHTNPEALADALVANVADWLRLASNGPRGATLVVPGGATPRETLERLSRQDLPWSRINLTLTDERWVPPDHADSNERLVRETLQRPNTAARSCRIIGLWRPDTTLDAACTALEASIGALRPFDLVILGMGLDGHIASLFPDMPSLATALERHNRTTCVAVPPLGDRQARVSLTLAALLDSRRIVLLILGEDKRQVYRQARKATSQLPVAALLQSEHPRIDVFWAPSQATSR